MPVEACLRRIAEVTGLVEDIERVLGSWTANQPEFLAALRARRDQLSIELADLKDQLSVLPRGGEEGMDVLSVREHPVPELDAPPHLTDAGTGSVEEVEPDRVPPGPEPEVAAPLQAVVASASLVHPTPDPLPSDKSRAAGVRSLAVIGIAALAPGLLALLLVWSMLTGAIMPGSAVAPPAQPRDGAPAARVEPPPQPLGISTATPFTQMAILASLNGSAEAPSAAASDPLVLDAEGLPETAAVPNGGAPADGPSSSGDDTVAPALEREEAGSAPELAYGRIQPPTGYRAASVHARPSTAAGIVAMVPRGGIVVLLDETAGGGGYQWRRIRTLDEVEGWIISAALRAASGATSP